jgi:hypothetical protein
LSGDVGRVPLLGNQGFPQKITRDVGMTLGVPGDTYLSEGVTKFLHRSQEVKSILEFPRLVPIAAHHEGSLDAFRSHAVDDSLELRSVPDQTG